MLDNIGIILENLIHAVIPQLGCHSEHQSHLIEAHLVLRYSKTEYGVIGLWP